MAGPNLVSFQGTANTQNPNTSEIPVSAANPLPVTITEGNLSLGNVTLAAGNATIGQLTGNQSVNLAQVGGTAAVTGGVAGSQGIGGLAANGVAAAGNPILIGGLDLGAITRSITVDANNVISVATVPYAQYITPLIAHSGNVAASTAAATLTGTSSTTVFISGFQCTGSGATVGAVVNVTVTGVLGGTLTYTFAAIAGVLLADQPLLVTFNPPLPASAINTPIVVSMPSLGTGNTNAAVNAQGFYK